MKRWQVERSSVVLDRKWLRVLCEHVVLPNGHQIPEFYKIESNDWVGVLAVTASDDIVLVEQYRHGLGAGSLELPAGVIDPGETAAAAAQRELLEETGFASDRFEHLITVSTEPSRHTTRAHFYFCRDARRVAEQELDPSEDMEVQLVSRKQVVELVSSGGMAHGIHVAAILVGVQRGLI